jgi:hypothetical protein
VIRSLSGGRIAVFGERPGDARDTPAERATQAPHLAACVRRQPSWAASDDPDDGVFGPGVRGTCERGRTLVGSGPCSSLAGKIGFGDWGRRVGLSPDDVGEVGIWEVIGFDSDDFVAGVFEPLLRASRDSYVGAVCRHGLFPFLHQRDC